MFDLLVMNKGAIYGISAICSLIFAVVIYSLVSNARVEPARRWAIPFADTFLVLGVLYAFRLIIYYYFPRHEAPASSFVNIFILLCSGLTNYLFIVSAYQLAEPTFEKRWLRRIESWVAGRPYFNSRLLWISWAVSLLGLAGPKAQFGDNLISAIALLSMGAALYRYRLASDKFMAWIAMISSVAYAFLYILQLFIDLILNAFLGNTATTTEMFSSALAMSSLILKFGLFFSAHSLMLWMSGPLRGFDQLFERTNREEKEYLESDGLVRSVCEWLKTNKVRLCVKLPGAKDDQIAVFHYPSTTQDGPQPRIEKYTQATSYDEVMEKASTYREDHEYHSQGSSKRVSIIAEPIFFHNSVTACLEAEVNGTGSNKKEARTNIERIANLKTTANLISPAVQTYREMSALNKLSQELAELQIAAVTFNLDNDIERIGEVVFDIASPSFIALSLDVGFWEYCSTYPKPVVNKQSFAGFTGSDCDEAVLNGGRRYRLLKTELGIPESQRPDEQIFGRLILGIEKDSARTRHPTIGTNPTCRRALSNLVSDTLLDFVRGQLNQLTDRLGVRLGRLESTAVGDWLIQVETTAKEAKLLWAVVRCADGEGCLIGKDQNTKLVGRLESPEQSERWQKKHNPGNPDGTEVTEMWIRVLRQPENGTFSIIKIPLKDSNATLWLGVGRAGFGHELDYVSPWKYFLHNFCKIADAALLRSLIMEERHRLMSELQHVVTQTMISGIVAHQLRNLALELEYTTITLDGLISDKEQAQELVSHLKTTRESSDELRQFLKDFSRDKNPSCSAIQAAHRAFALVKKSLNNYQIKFHKYDPPYDTDVKVPFQILSNTMAIVFNNAKEAIRDAQQEDGSIEITFSLSKDQTILLCDLSNNGPEIPSEIRRVLFEAPIRSDKKDSHGLGLYCSAHVLRFYGAEIMLLPEETHPRTTFRIRVPRLIN